MSKDHREPIFQTYFEGSRCCVQNPWRWLIIFQGVAVAVRDNLWDRDVFWVNPVGTTASDEQGACNLMDIVAASTYVGDIFRGSNRVGPITALKCELKLRRKN